MTAQLTFAMIKSRAVADGVNFHIMKDYAIHFQVVRWQPAVLRKEEIDALYRDHVDKPYYPDLLDSVNHGVILMVFKGQHALDRWRKMMGATNPINADIGTIRYYWGSKDRMADNVVHGSATAADAHREIDLFFPGLWDQEHGRAPVA